MPSPCPLPLPISEDPEWIHDRKTECFPFMIVADDAFPLKLQIMNLYSHRNLDDKKILFNTKHQDVEGLQRMHLVSCNADLDCSYLQHVCHQKLQSIYFLWLSHCTISWEQSPAIHIAPQKCLMKKSISKPCAQDPGGVTQALVCLWVYKVADKTTAIPKMLKKSEMD